MGTEKDLEKLDKTALQQYANKVKDCMKNIFES